MVTALLVFSGPPSVKQAEAQAAALATKITVLPSVDLTSDDTVVADGTRTVTYTITVEFGEPVRAPIGSTL